MSDATWRLQLTRTAQRDLRRLILRSAGVWRPRCARSRRTRKEPERCASSREHPSEAADRRLASARSPGHPSTHHPNHPCAASRPRLPRLSARPPIANMLRPSAAGRGTVRARPWPWLLGSSLSSPIAGEQSKRCRALAVQALLARSFTASGSAAARSPGRGLSRGGGAHRAALRRLSGLEHRPEPALQRLSQPSRATR